MKHLFKRSLALLCVLAMLLSIAPLSVFAAEDTSNEFVVLSTTDMHGRVWDKNVLNDTNMNNSMLNVATAVKEIRASYGNVILLDNGDTYQGTPVSSYQLSLQKQGLTELPNPMALAMKEIDFDAATIGNHEFNYAWDLMEEVRAYLADETQGNVVESLCANLYYEATGENVFTPYMFKEFTLNGESYKIAIIGFENTDCPRWDVPDNYPGIVFTHPDNTTGAMAWEAEKYVAEVKAQGADLVIVAYHSGLGDGAAPEDIKFGVNSENQILSMIKNNTGIDMVIAGHDHSSSYSGKTYADKEGKDVLVVNGAGNNLTKTVFAVDAEGKLYIKSNSVIGLSTKAADADLKAKIAPYVELASEYVNQECGTILPGEWSKSTKFYLQQTDTMDIVGRAQIAMGTKHLAEKYDTETEVAELFEKTGLDHLEVDMSSTSVVVSGSYTVQPGTMTMKKIYQLYKYDNTLYLIPLTGQQIKDVLEFNASQRLTVSTASGTAVFGTTGDDFTNPVFYGLDFVYDMSEEPGNRAEIKGFANGKEFKLDETYIFAINNYHLGNGPFAQYSTEDAIWSQTDDMGGGVVQDLIAEWLAEETATNGGVAPAPSNWEIVYNGEIVAGKAEGEFIGDYVDPATLNTGDRVLIYYPAGNSLVSTKASGSKLAPDADVTIGVSDAGVKQAGTNTASNIFTVEKAEDGSILFLDETGKYMTSGTTGNSLSMAATANDCSRWTFEATNGGYFVHNVGANYNGNHNQYLEFYSGFTTYGMGANTAIYTFHFYKLPAGGETPCEHNWDNGTVTAEPTCTEPGETTFTCTLCGTTKTEPIMATGNHTYEGGSCIHCGAPDPSVPVTGDTYVRVNELQEGDEIIIVCHAKNIALGGEYGGSFYNPGIAVNPVDDKIVTDDSTIVWTVGKEGDFYTFSYNGKKIAMGTGYTSMPLGEVNYKWQVTPAQNEGTFYVANLDRDPSQAYYMQWYEAKNYWSAYFKLDDTLMAMSFYKKEAQPKPEVQDIVILYTNDVHTYINNAADKGMKYSNVAALKAELEAEGKTVILVDAGDHVQGTAYGSMDKGETIIKLMNAAGYDLATLGNHEFDYGMARALELVGKADFPYVSANFYNEKDGVKGETVLDAYQIFEVDGVKIALVGITTPETFTKSTPAYFMDENGNYIYGISAGDDGAALYADVQAAIDAAYAEGATYVIALGHLGDDPASDPWNSEDVIAHVSGLHAFIDGHSHSTVEGKYVTDKEGYSVLLTQTGEYLKAIGMMTIGKDGITTELITAYEGVDEEVKAIEDAWAAEVDTLLGEVIAKNEVDFRINGDEGRLIRKQETNLGDFAADALYYLFDVTEGLGVDVAIMNGGGIRADMPVGDVSYKTTKTVHTFGNVACLIEVTGQQILDALEWGAKNVGVGENGGFLHVSGVTYEIHSYIPSTVQADDKGVWAGAPTGEYRVKNVTIGGEPLDVTKTYKMAGYNYTLRDLGDGFAMFDGAVNVKDYVMEDYMVLANYAKSFPEATIKADNSVLGANYGDINGEGRITIVTEKEEVSSDEIVILYTNDVHTYINNAADKGLKYSNVAALKAELEAEGKTVILVDAGDHVQGTAYGSMDKGETIIKLMNASGYDLATLGNHEFDYGMARALELVGKASFPYVSANFYNEKDGVKGETVLDAYKIFEIDGVKIALIGITTPETFTKSTPAYFMDENGNYIYGIAGGNDGAALYADVQAAIDAAYAEGATYVIALGHLGDDPASDPWNSEDVIAHVSGLHAFIDGHSHSTVEGKYVTDKDGYSVLLTQTGEYLKAVGKMTIGKDGITTELITAYEGVDEEVKAIEDAWAAEVDTLLGEVIAKNEVDFRINGDEGRLIRKQETNLGDFAADALYYLFDVTEGLGVDVAIMNGGGIRADMPAGDVSYKTTKTVHTFGNVACLIEVTGQQILDALEWGAKNVGVGENGGFLHVSGVTYEIHSYIPSTVQADDKGVWAGAPTGEYRVKNVTIGGEPLDVTKTYKMAGYNYTLRDLGDGFAMFEGATNVKDYVMEDYMVLANYAKSFPEATIKADNSVLGANYGDINGEGRITIVEEVPFVNPYTDVAEDAWYYDYVMEASQKGLVNGFNDGTFKPEANLTRAQFAVMLYRLLGSPSAEGLENPYSDLEADWYKDAILYMTKIGVVNGTGHGKFSPQNNITREQMVTMLHRMAQITVTEGYEVLNDFVDKDAISGYAVEPMVWAINSGIINGTGKGRLSPQGLATRAQSAKVLSLFADILEKGY